MRGFGWLSLCFALLSVATGCGEADSDGAVGSHQHVARTSGSAVVLSYDERIAVATNRGEGFVTVFALKPERGPTDMVVNTTVLDLGEGSEPWAAVIGADDDTAYVILRKAQTLIRIDHLRSAPIVAPRTLQLGSEPSSIAITPTGKLVFVANWGEGTISAVSTDDFRLGAALDLNASLQMTGSLGDIKSRAALAHPRALAITDDGDQDDDDEALYATEFFSQPLPPPADPTAVDSNRVGIVYPIALETGQQGTPIPIDPVAATGFVDSNGKMTSCFPNQLFAAAAEGNRLYVTSMCTSPQGPLDKVVDDTSNFKTLFHPAVFAIDTTRDDTSKTRVNREIPSEGRVLTQVLQTAYDADAAAGLPTVEVRMPLLPNDIVFGASSNGGSSAFVLALGADALFRLDYDAKHKLVGIGSPQHRYVPDLPIKGYAVGLAISRRAKHAFGLALSDVTQRLSVIDLEQGAVASKRPSMPDTPRAEAAIDLPENLGRGLFATGLGQWSFQGAAWSSCEGCHPGGLSDGVTWYFSRGPRRTLSAANTYEKNTDQPHRRLLLWGANVDEIHDVEVIVRTVSGGAGAMVWSYPPDAAPSNDCRLVYDGKTPSAAKAGAKVCANGAKPTTNLLNGLNGALSDVVTNGLGCRDDDTTCDNSALQDWNEIDAFIRSLRAPKPPTNLERDRVTLGSQTFIKAGCVNCHGGAQWTISTLFYKPSLEENGAAPSIRPDSPPPIGKLREDVYSVSEELAFLNPPARDSTRMGCVTGTKCATFRNPPKSDSADDRLLMLYGDPKADPVVDAGKVASNDQLRCALRDVGTFPVFGTMAPGPGVAPSTGSAPTEVRQDMKTLAQGKDGFSVPSLFGLSVGAPYFHAGNARSLEELFDDNFSPHHQSVAKDFLSLRDEDRDAQRDENIQNLIQFLLSIDESTPVAGEPPAEYDFCARTP